MAQTISVDSSGIVDAQQIDAADVTTPISDLKTAIEAALNGTQAFDAININSTAESTTITTGAVTITRSYAEINAESGTADDLDTITLADGTFAFIRAATGDTITLKHGTGNITIVGDSDIALTGNDTALIFQDGSQIGVIGGAGAGGGGMTSFTLAGDSGGGQTISDGNTASVLGGSGIVTADSATDTVTISQNQGAGAIDTLSSGVLTIGNNRNIIVAAESGTADDLIEVSGLSVGETVWLRADAGDTITVKHNDAGATIKIYLYGNADVTLDEQNPLILQYVDTNVLSQAIDEDTGGGSGLYASIAILSDTKTSGTNGGSASSGWNARDLQTEDNDDDSIVSISSNTFTPTSGQYRASWHVTVFGSTASNTDLRTRLYNSTGAAAVDESANVRIISNSGGTLLNHSCKFTANGTDAYRIDTYHSVAQATVGLGAAVSDGSPEKYLVLTLEKLS